VAFHLDREGGARLPLPLRGVAAAGTRGVLSAVIATGEC
jgi:hypothetical protein